MEKATYQPLVAPLPLMEIYGPPLQAYMPTVHLLDMVSSDPPADESDATCNILHFEMLKYIFICTHVRTKLISHLAAE